MAADVAPGELESRDESVLQRFRAFPEEVELLHSAVDLTCDDDLDEALLAREPAEHGHSRDAGAASDIFHGGAPDAVLGELVERRRGNPVKERVLAHDGSHLEEFGYWRPSDTMLLYFAHSN